MEKIKNFFLQLFNKKYYILNELTQEEEHYFIESLIQKIKEN